MTLDEVINYNRLLADMEYKSGDLEVAEYYLNTAKCLEELKELIEQKAEYKRLLNAAVEDLNCTSDCVVCMYVKDNNCPDDRENCGFKWRYADEVLKLIES